MEKSLCPYISTDNVTTDEDRSEQVSRPNGRFKVQVRSRISVHKNNDSEEGQPGPECSKK